MADYKIICNWIAFVILAIGGLNWGLVGIFNFNLVEWICMGFNVGSRIIYILVLISTIWLIVSMILDRAIRFFENRKES